MAAPKKIGRPSVVDERLKGIIIRMAEKGQTMQEIANVVKISKQTLYNALGKDGAFLDALKKSTSLANDLVEASLFRRATGYSHTAVKIFYDKNTGKCVEHKYTEIYAPSEVAAIFWLKNRDPERWREKQEIDLTKDITVKIADDEQGL